MWRCLKCGEQIDDNFGACWKCGTGRDGTAAVRVRRTGQTPPTCTNAKRTSRTNRTSRTSRGRTILVLEEEDTGQRIVELCSAANMVEANCLCEQLAESGIETRVVGDFLASAAGGLPLGEAISPRIWVHQRDQARGARSRRSMAQ